MYLSNLATYVPVALLACAAILSDRPGGENYLLAMPGRPG